MKKFAFVVFVFVCLFTGCAQTPSLRAEEPLASSDNLSSEESKEYVITNSPYEDWDQYHPSDYLQDDLVKTEENAITIANAIVENAVSEEKWKELYLANVWEDVDCGVWVISYSVQSEDANVIMVGGDINIAIRKHDAQVVKMWAEV